MRNHTASKMQTIFLIALLVLCVSSEFGNTARAQYAALAMSVYCPERVYIGESFVCQVDISNVDSNVSHNYLLLWIVDNFVDETPTFNSSGTLAPNETMAVTSSFTFSESSEPTVSFLYGYNAHMISLKLVQDNEFLVAEDQRFINAVQIDSSLTYTITPYPIYQNSSFSLNLAVVNEGDEAINASISIHPMAGMQNKIQLQSGASANLSTIPHGASKNSTFSFAVTPDTPSGIYPIKVKVDFYDVRGRLYSKNHYVPIEVSSREILDKFNLLDSEVGNKLREFSDDVAELSRNMTAITIALLLVSAGLAGANYWYARRVRHTRRRVTAEE
jgi:hypothetical protein